MAQIAVRRPRSEEYNLISFFKGQYHASYAHALVAGKVRMLLYLLTGLQCVMASEVYWGVVCRARQDLTKPIQIP